MPKGPFSTRAPNSEDPPGPPCNHKRTGSSEPWVCNTNIIKHYSSISLSFCECFHCHSFQPVNCITVSRLESWSARLQLPSVPSLTVFHRSVSFDTHATLMVIGVLLQMGRRSGIPCRPNCNNATLLNNLNGIDLLLRDMGLWRFVTFKLSSATQKQK